MATELVWSKPWYKSRGVWGSLLAFAGTVYGLWGATQPCGPLQSFHNYASAGLALLGSYYAFAGRRTASQPIHFLWRYQKEVAV